LGVKIMSSENKNTRRSGILRALSLLSQTGFAIAACVFIGVLAGKYLDGLLGTAPLLLLTFSLLGAAAAIKSIFDIGKKM